MKIETLWIVTKPTPHSVTADILFEADAARLALQFRGGLEADQIVGMFTDAVEARKVAIDLLDTRDEGADTFRRLYAVAERADTRLTETITSRTDGKRDRWTLSSTDMLIPEIADALREKVNADEALMTFMRTR